MSDSNLSDIALISEDIYEKFKSAVEIGKWENGQKITQQQREICMQAIIRYDLEHLPEEQRVGYVPPKNNESGKSNLAQLDEQLTSETPQTVKWTKD